MRIDAYQCNECEEATIGIDFDSDWVTVIGILEDGRHAHFCNKACLFNFIENGGLK